MVSSHRSRHEGLVRREPTADGRIRVAFDLAYGLALSRRKLLRLSEDQVHDGATKWWARLNRAPFPEYLIEDGQISIAWLAGWILKSAAEARALGARKNTRAAQAGYTSYRGTEGDFDERADLNLPSLEERAAERVDAARALTALGPVHELDRVLRYRALDLSFEEIGAELGITAGAARVRVLRASRRLVAKSERDA